MREDLPQVEGASFYALVMALEQLTDGAPRIGSTEAAERERIRFRANPTLAFPAGDVAALVERDDGIFDVIVNFLGVIGPASPLPAFYTELAIRDADDGGIITEFLDLFHHRLTSLLYVAWRHNRLEVRCSADADDAICRRLGALIGLSPDLDDDALPLSRARLLPFLGALVLHNRSAGLVARVIAALVGVPCRIEEFIPREVTIPPDCRAFMGQSGVTLGSDMVIGERVPDRLGKFRVVLGPLEADAFRSFLPGGEGLAAVTAAVGLSVRDPLAWDCALELAPGAAPAWSLGTEPLGWSTWLAPDPCQSTVVIL